MDPIYLVVGIGALIVIVLIIVIAVVVYKSNHKDDNVFANMKVEKLPELNKNDVHKLNNLNDNFVVNKPQKQNIAIPNFKKNKPIGYQNMSHVQGTYGDRVAQTHNKN